MQNDIHRAQQGNNHCQISGFSLVASPRPATRRRCGRGPAARSCRHRRAVCFETKEHIGGFWILEATDLDKALRVGGARLLSPAVRR